MRLFSATAYLRVWPLCPSARPSRADRSRGSTTPSGNPRRGEGTVLYFAGRSPPCVAGSDLAADQGIEREATAATDDETQCQGAPQQRVFVSALGPEEAVGPVDLNYRHRHQADDQSRRYPGDEAQGEQ